MKKPARLEMNNSGAWKLIVRFDAADDDHTDALMNAAESLAKEVPGMKLRISDGDVALMYWTHERGIWHDARTLEPA